MESEAMNEEKSKAYALGKFMGIIQGLKTGADILRLASSKDAVIKIFVPGQAPKQARVINRALLNKCAGIMDGMACDMEGGKIIVDAETGQLKMAPKPDEAV